MAGYVILGTLAAFGTLCALWVISGWLLPLGRGAALVCLGVPEEGIFLRVRWLQRTGLMNSPLIIVAEEPVKIQQSYGIEYCSPEQLIARLEQERKQFDGTGNGDPAGRDQRRGISEL